MAANGSLFSNYKVYKSNQLFYNKKSTSARCFYLFFNMKNSFFIDC